ncbi:MAG: hypothetical protein LBB89_12865 [Treponema sp.]|jgi:hypothetical protein|nr:hypothetical protein [Treponema sp.]
MRKNIFQVIYILFMGLFIYSCSELILPDQVKVKGTLKLPIRVGAKNLNSMLAKKINEAFSAGAEEGTKVYNVDYKGQTVQTFCIYIPIEMTEDLNPDNFLKTIDEQINGDMKAEPRKIGVSVPVGVPIPIEDIKIIGDDNKIPPVSLVDMAQYVVTIDFNECNYEENDYSEGIGLNFHFTKIPPGLEMSVTCEGLRFPDPDEYYKPLVEGDNVFGNKEQLTLALAEYKKNEADSQKKLRFIMTLRSANPANRGEWVINDPDLSPGDMTKIEGEMRFFRVWKKAEINLAAAIKSSSKLDEVTGKYPDRAFDFSGLQDYFDGGFTFNDMEVKIYMDGPDSDSINNKLEPKLWLGAQYSGNTGDDRQNLYNDALFISQNPINLGDYLDENKSYKYQHLPEEIPGYDGTINEETVADIFLKMPADLSFIYSIKVKEDKFLIVYPETFADDSGENSSITTTMMIMLPMSLTATGDGDSRSTVSFPYMFGKDEDLFGREEAEDLFSAADIDYIRMTIDFSDKIFTDGHLFINKEYDDLFPQGIKLNGKKTVFNFTDEELEVIKGKLIFPDIKVEIDNGGTINVPKNMGIVSIKFETKSIINIGEL